MKKITKNVLKGALAAAAFTLCSASFNKDRVQVLAQTIESGTAEQLPNKSNTAFREGEVLTYRMHYGLLNAGVAVLEVKPDLIEVNGRKVYHIFGSGCTNGSTDLFFKMTE